MLGIRETRRRPIEATERQVRHRRGWRKFDGSSECLFRQFAVAATELHLTKVGIGGTLRRIQLDGCFEFGNRAIEILQTGKCVRTKHLCINVLWIEREGLLRSQLGVVKSPCHQEEVAGFQLDGGVGHDVGGADVLPERLCRITLFEVGVCELEPDVAGFRLVFKRI